MAQQKSAQQLDAFLMQIKQKPNEELDKSLKIIKEILTKSSASLLQSKLYKKFSAHLHQTEFEYFAPQQFKVVGSYLLKSKLGTLTADLAVEIPKETFKEKDHLNKRYFYKRDCYLAALAAALADVASIKFEMLNEKPVLILEFPGYFIRIIPSISADQFPASRLAVDKNSLRAAFLGIEEQPTPYYNNAILSDMRFNDHLQFINSNCKSLDTLLMLKQWAIERNFSTFVISMIYASLVKSGIVSDGTSLQQFRAVLTFMAGVDAKKCQALCEISVFEAVAFKDGFSACLIDPSKTVNLLSSCSESEFDFIGSQAKFTLSKLAHDQKVSDCLFLFQEPFTFDCEFAVVCESNCTEDLMKFGETRRLLRFKIAQALHYALGDRVKVIYHSADRLQWPLDSPQPTQTEFKFGLVFDQSHAYRKVDNGPSASDPKALEFRTFWGDKSELRKFKNGAIQETLIWQAEKYQIVPQIVEFVMRKHFQAETKFLQSDMEFCLKKSSKSTDFAQLFDEFASNLRGLKEVPLQIVQVNCMSPAWRRSSLYDQVHPVQIMFESSPNWPRDLEAVRNYKAAFYLKLGELLYGKPTMDFVDIKHKNLTFRVSIQDHPTDHLITQQLHDLVLLNPVFGDSCIAIKRFVFAQMVPISETLVDLICTTLFMSDRKHKFEPGHFATAFSRFLSLVSKNETGFLIDFTGNHQDSISSPGVVRVVLDSQTVDLEIPQFKHLKKCCINALKNLNSPKSLFVPNLAQFDAVFFFDQQFVQENPLNLKPQKKFKEIQGGIL